MQTRHADRMLLTEFLRTRVLELPVHGLDLANALERQPWMTPWQHTSPKTLLPSAAAARLRAQAGWDDQVTAIAKLNGRRPLTPAETQLSRPAGIQRLALSQPSNDQPVLHSTDGVPAGHREGRT